MGVLDTEEKLRRAQTFLVVAGISMMFWGTIILLGFGWVTPYAGGALVAFAVWPRRWLPKRKDRAGGGAGSTKASQAGTGVANRQPSAPRAVPGKPPRRRRWS